MSAMAVPEVNGPHDLHTHEAPCPLDAATPPSSVRAKVKAVGNDDTSAGKALALLDAFSGQMAVVGVTTLAARADMPKSTAHRLLTVLVARGYVRRVRDRYSLTEHMFYIGNQVQPCQPNEIRELATPYLGELFAETRQTVHLGVLSGAHVLYLSKVAGRDAAPSPTFIGARRPAYATALGKALLAFADDDDVQASMRSPFRRFTPYTMNTVGQLQRCIERVRQDGIATDREELRLGVNCLAAPIVDPRSGRVVAALSVCSGNTAGQDRYRRTLTRAATDLARHYAAAA